MATIKITDKPTITSVLGTDKVFVNKDSTLRQATIDNVVGASATATELTDVRTDVDGTTHSSAGEAVRSQVTALHEKINTVNSDLTDVINTKAPAIVQTVEGESVATTDSADMVLQGMDLYGKSEQDSTTGKNLVDFALNSNVASNYGSLIIGYDLTTIIEGKTYTVSAYLEASAETTAYWNIGSGIFPQKSFSIKSGKNRYSYTFVALKDGEYKESGYPILSKGNSSDSIAITCTDAQIEESDTVTDYEPYTGGQPSPNPSYPQEIRNIGVYDEASGKYAVEVKCTGKNLLKNTSPSGTINGIKFTVNDDGSVTANGTSTAIMFFTIGTINVVSGETYTVNGCPNGGSAESYGVTIRNSTNTNVYATDFGSGGTYTFKSDTVAKISIRIANGVTISNLTFYPMIRLATIEDDTYEPYKETTATVLLDEPLRKGDKVYWNGGSKVRIDRYRAVAVFNGSENWKKSDATGRYRASLVGVKYISEADMPIVLTNRYIAIIGNDYLKYTQGISSSNEYMYIVNNEIQTVEEFKSILAENPITVEYELATPITEEIDIDLGELSMFYPTTIISNDCNANMEVTYVVDTKTYIDKKFAELSEAILSLNS